MKKPKNKKSMELFKEGMAEIAQLVESGELTEAEADQMRKWILTTFNRALLQSQAGQRFRF
jgi:hypothetical protein